ncbi:hypothetical protein BH11PSE11_BH11PSE11_23440 [soil metagenome]
MEHTSHTCHRRKGFLVPVLLIIVGTTLFLERTGAIDREMLRLGWPILLTFAGGWLLFARIKRTQND